MTTPNRWDSARNILCIRLDTIGDVLMTTPAMRALREGRSDRRITLLTSPSGAAVASLVPEIDEVIVYDAPWMKATAPRESSAADQAMIERLRKAGFDAAVIFTVFSQNPLPAAMMCYLAEIPLRLAHCHENPYQLLTDWVKDAEPEAGIRHEVRRQLDLAAAVGRRTADERLSLRVPDEADARVAELLAGLELGGRPWTVVHPGSTAASRRYPPDSFAEVARQLYADHGIVSVFTGSGPECYLVQGIQMSVPAPTHSLAGMLDLGDMAALIRRAPLLISNNSGPVHIAAAVGTPVVDLYALTNPQHTPWAVPNRVLNHDVPCKFCYKSVCPEGHHNCLRLVEPGQVVDAALELLRETGAGRSAKLPHHTGSGVDAGNRMADGHGGDLPNRPTRKSELTV